MIYVKYLPIVGVIFTAAGIVYNIWNNRRNAFNSAAEKFRTAFRDESIALDSSIAIGPANIDEFLVSAFDKHNAAFQEFLPIMRKFSSFDAGGLEEAWNEYYKHYDRYNFMVQYAGTPNCGEEEARRRKNLAKRHIDRILYYAQNR